jgi:autotransporter-associated beta strand protein
LLLNGGSIRDAAAQNARLGLAAPGTSGSLGNSKALVIDGAIPTISGDRGWDGGGTNDAWSNAENWIGDTLPQATDQVLFNATSNDDATIDTGFTSSIARLQIDSTYAGSISLGKSITVGSLFGSGGNVNLGGHTLTTGADNAHGAYAGVLSGPGALNKIGVGSYYLRGNNSYDGPTTITDGSILVSANNALGTDAGGTTVGAGANARLVFEKSVNYTALEPVTINGSGFNNSGALIGVGNSTFAGPVTLGSASTVSVAPAGYTFTLKGELNTNGNLLTVKGSGSMVLGGIISGTGGLTKTDPNTVTLSRQNTYTGATVVNGGTLLVTSSGSIADSPTTVNANAILAGNGTVGTVVVNGGMVSPGMVNPGVDIGTLTGSAADFSDGGVLRLQVNGYGADEFDRLVLTGALTLGGTSKLSLDVAALSDDDVVTSAISFGSVSGTFSTIELINNSQNFRACVLNYGSSPLNITIAPAGGACGAWSSSASESGAVGDLDPLLAPSRTLAATARPVTVASLDSGIDYLHPDLYQNIWINQDEIPSKARGRLRDVDRDGRITFRDLNHSSNQGRGGIVKDLNRNGFIDAGDLLQTLSDGRDEDKNGYVDDLIGWDFVNNDNDPRDDSGHGTHGAGVMIQVAPMAEVLPLKFLDAKLVGTLANAGRALDYALAKKVTISSNGWVARDFSQEWLDQLTSASAAGHLVITAAGNSDSMSLEILRQLKSSQLLVVAAADVYGELAPFSNWDPEIVDLIMPGVGVLSAMPGGGQTAHSGTSVATAYAAGLAALQQGRRPGMTRADLVDALMADSQTAIDWRVDDRRLSPVLALAADLYFAQKKRDQADSQLLDDDTEDSSALLDRLLRNKGNRGR